MYIQKLIILTVVILFFSLDSLRGEKAIKASAVPANSQLINGEVIEIPINIDLSKLSETLLGSFTAVLRWDHNVMQFEEYRGGNTPGFENPVVNTADVGGGILGFAHANPYGAKGSVNVLNLEFKVIGDAGARASISLIFTAMASTKTFRNLLSDLDPSSEREHLYHVISKPGNYSISNYPNPFNPTTAIKYSIPDAGEVRIMIYNIIGQRVRVLVDERQVPGEYVVDWDSKNDQGEILPSGMYFLKMQVGDFEAERKLLLLR